MHNKHQGFFFSIWSVFANEFFKDYEEFREINCENLTNLYQKKNPITISFRLDQKQKSISGPNCDSFWDRNLTFVTMMMDSTSPLLKGRSCSVVPLKLYLATHSVPCGHGVYGTDLSQMIHQTRNNISFRTQFWHTQTARLGPSYLDLCHGEAVWSSHKRWPLSCYIRAGTHTRIPAERMSDYIIGRPKYDLKRFYCTGDMSIHLQVSHCQSKHLSNVRPDGE